MKKKVLMILLAVSLTLNGVVLFAGCSQGWNLNLGGSNTSTTAASNGSKDEDSSSADASSREAEIMEKLEKIDKVIDNYYLNEEEIDEDDLLEGLYAGYVRGLNEAYTTYYTAQQYKDMMESSSGSYSGIGVVVSQNANTGIITVINPFETGPGYEAGIRKEDIIYKVLGEEVTGKDISEVVAKIKGEPGTTVDLTIYRPSEDKYIDLTIERRMVEYPTITYEMKEDQIGYIQCVEFDDVTVDQFANAIADLQAQGMKGLVIDLRDNPGGLLTAVCAMLDRILPEGLLVYTMDKDGNKEEHFADNKETLELPMVVLVNGNSASASEIFTAALKDYDTATIMGTTTFGKGIVQVIIPLGDGSAVKLTTSKYYTPNGYNIHETGVEPDIVVEKGEDPEVDTQLDAAMEEMRGMIAQ